MGEIHTEEQPDLEGTVASAHFHTFPPLEYVCEGLEELAELHADAKQAFLEQTGHFEDLRGLTDDRSIDSNKIDER